MDATKPLKINATAFWAFLDKPNQMSGSYQIDLGQLSDAAVRAVEAMGIEVKQKDDRGFYITCKSRHEIHAYDRNKERIYDTVGNGSKVVAVIGSYDWTFKNKKGKSPSLKGLVVTDLVKYETGPDVNDTEEAL